MSDPSPLTEALAKVQAQLPPVNKAETAKVRTKAGDSYSYTYADLADISAAVLPLLGANGLAWVCRPTVGDAGHFVLAYELRHVGGEVVEGVYPLPDPARATAQEVGSAITYGRRYCLCSVTGVAPGDDDDGAAASAAKPAPERQRPEPRTEPRTERPAKPAEPDEPKAEKIPTSPIGWRNFIDRRQVGLDTLRDAFGHDEEIVRALNEERWAMAVKALPGPKQHELFEHIMDKERPPAGGNGEADQ